MPTKKSTRQKVNPSINPQLCKTYNPTKHDWSHCWIAEPKFDGLRCNIVNDRAYSRNGKPLWNLGNILGELVEKDFTLNVLDGEVFVKDWNTTMSIVKRSTKEHPDQDSIKYHVFDCLTLEEWKKKYKDSHGYGKVGISRVSNHYRKERLAPLSDCKHIEIVQGIVVNNEEELNNAYLKFLEQGYEGAMLKDPEGIYECGRRSSSWLKVKPWSDADLTVVGSYPGEGKHLGRIGGLVLEGEVEWNGSSYNVRTEVGTGFSDEERQEFQRLVDSQTLNGKIVEIRYQEITADGSCRFPVYSRLRTDRE